jgi:hypothetical protein
MQALELLWFKEIPDSVDADREFADACNSDLD